MTGSLAGGIGMSRFRIGTRISVGFCVVLALMAAVAVVGYLDLQAFYDWLRSQAALLLPPQAMEQVDAVIVQFERQKAGLFSIAILFALWTASAGSRSAMVAMNRA